MEVIYTGRSLVNNGDISFKLYSIVLLAHLTSLSILKRNQDGVQHIQLNAGIF